MKKDHFFREIYKNKIRSSIIPFLILRGNPKDLKIRKGIERLMILKNTAIKVSLFEYDFKNKSKIRKGSLFYVGVFKPKFSHLNQKSCYIRIKKVVEQY